MVFAPVRGLLYETGGSQVFADLLGVVSACSGADLDDLAVLCRVVGSEVRAAPFVEAGLDGAELGRALDDTRTKRIALAQREKGSG